MVVEFRLDEKDYLSCCSLTGTDRMQSLKDDVVFSIKRSTSTKSEVVRYDRISFYYGVN